MEVILIMLTCAQFAIIGSKLWIDTMAEICEPESTTNLEQNLMNEKKNSKDI